MTARLAHESARAVTAERLGCHETTVRELLRKGSISGPRVGKSDRPNGVRVKMWSIEEGNGSTRSAENGTRRCRNLPLGASGRG